MERKLKLAMVKQEIYDDLYVAKPGDALFYGKSPARSGPMGLFTEFDTDFFIVKQDPSEECHIWRQKLISPGHHTLDEWNAVPSTFEHMGILQGECSIGVDDIPFQCYDVVISVDISVPSRLVHSFPNVLWCYYITEPPMQAYKDSKSQPLFGYDIFLNQRFRLPEELAKNGQDLPGGHEIDFPYTLASSETYRKLFGFEVDEAHNGPLRLAIPRYVERALGDSRLARLRENYIVTSLGGYNCDFLGRLCRSDVYLRLGNQPKFGNEAIEAVAAGAAFIASPRGWRNRVFNVPRSTISPHECLDAQLDEALDTLAQLSSVPSLMFGIKAAQAEILNDLCFRSPIGKLKQAYWRKVLDKI